MSEETESVLTKHAYEIVEVHLKTGDVLRLAQNGTGLFHDLFLDGAMHNITIPPENVKMIVPYPLTYTNDEPGKTLEEYYMDIVVKDLRDYKFLKACVIARDSKEFETALYTYDSMQDLKIQGGISIEELIIHEQWEFIAVLIRSFHHLPLSRKSALQKMLKEKSTEHFELSKMPLIPKEAYL